MFKADHEEERLARIEHMLEQLRKDPTARQGVTAKVIEAVIEVSPAMAVTPRPKRQRLPDGTAIIPLTNPSHGPRP
jgi:hypothetical protein